MNHNMLLLTWFLSTYRDDIFQLKFLWPTKKRSIEMCTISYVLPIFEAVCW